MKPTFVQLIEQVEPFVSPEMFNEIIIAFGYHPDMDIIVNDDNFFIGMHGDVLIVSNSILCEIVKNNFDVINDINGLDFEIEFNRPNMLLFHDKRSNNDYNIEFNMDDDPFIIHRIG